VNAEHLKIIQGVINRMAQVSFVLKGWNVTLVVAILGFAAKSADVSLSLFALLPAVAFWGLDAYYLRQEKLFRELYARVIGSKGEEIPKFSMDTSICNASVPTWWRMLFNPTIIALHGSVIVIIIIISTVICYRG
jgi:hypothetical protein